MPAPFLLGALTLGAVGLSAFSQVIANRAHLRAQRKTWRKQLGGEFKGIRVTRRGMILAEIDGTDARLDLRGPRPPYTATAQVHFPPLDVHPDLRARRLKDALRGDGSTLGTIEAHLVFEGDPGGLALIKDHLVYTRLEQLGPAVIEVTDSSVTLGRPGTLLDDALVAAREAVSLARLLQRAARGPLRELGLTLGLPNPEARVLHGVIDGISVHIQRRTRGPLIIRATLPTPLPAGFSVRLRDGEGGLVLGDPVLDPMLMVTGSAPEAVRALLTRDGLRGDLLTVLHGHPGSHVSATEVVTRAPFEQAEDATRDAVSLAKALTPARP